MRMRCSAAVKITAGILSVLMLLGAVLSVGLWIAAENMHFSTSSYAYLADELKQNLVHYHLLDVWHTWQRGDDAAEVYRETNLIFRLRDENGNILAESADADRLSENAYVRICSMHKAVMDPSADTSDTTQSSVFVTDGYGDAMYAATSYQMEQIRYTLEGDVHPELPYTDRYSVLLTALDLYYEMYRALPLIALAYLALWIVCLCVLLRCVGWHKGDEVPRRAWTEYIPYDLLLVGAALMIPLHEMLFYQDDAAFIVMLGIFALADAVILTLFLCTTAVRLKTRTLLKSTLIWYVWQLLRRLLRWFCRGIRVAFGTIPLVWKTALCLFVLGAADLIAALYSLLTPGSIFVYLLLKNLVIGAAILFCAVLMRRIQAGCTHLAAGDLNAKIDTKYMFGDFLAFSDRMNRIGDGMSAAVDERLKSEHLRTELITNVSHDIKTPLTSIVNYVDLMQKENVTEEPLAGYIEVLARQSARLKKLTEDLVEASKAATGNITVHAEVLDVSMMLMQTAGEYDEKFRAAHLDLILRQPPDPVHIIADGRLLWRVFDNLMNNIVKYAMAGTRVYLTLRTDGDAAEILFRNIARDELNVAEDELLERFTRGDVSRSTEGSGLGLSIAKSLTELQGGTLQLHVDGDLFKVAVRFSLKTE